MEFFTYLKNQFRPMSLKKILKKKIYVDVILSKTNML